VAIEAQRRTTAMIEFLIDKAKLLDRLRGQLNPRQEKALLRMFREGPGGFVGGVSAGRYATITGASPATATRDLVELVAMGALTRTGELQAHPLPERAGRPGLTQGLRQTSELTAPA
jgi:Fic family protein